MTVKEFWEWVEQSLKENKGSEKEGVGWFIGDMEELIDKWEESKGCPNLGK